MKNFIITSFFMLCATLVHAQKVFETTKDYLHIKINNKLKADNWVLNKDINPDVFELETTDEHNTITYTDGINSISFDIKQGQEIDFLVLKNKTDSAYQRIKTIPPNVNFTKEYINKYQGKSIVAIPEVSELVNVLMALHPDAENEDNMFDTTTTYYKNVKTYFAPYLNHPAIDTITKYIKDITYVEDYKIKLFSRASYNYYYALKMTACGYHFTDDNLIINDGYIKEIGKGYYTFNPMKDVKVFEDFARISNFRQFYKENQPYYDRLLSTYYQLNPIQKMQTWLDTKFGFSYGSYLIYFSPLVYGAHSTRGIEDNNFAQTIMFIARADFDENISKTQNELLESRVLFTEIDHNYVNPVSDTYLNRINNVMSTREKWAKPIITDSYNTPYKVFNEYMTFAVYSLYIHDHYNEKDVVQYLPNLHDMMVNTRGFILFKEFNEVMLAKYKEDKTIKLTALYEYMLDWCAKQNE